MHGIEEARHLAWDFCQDVLCQHLLRSLKIKKKKQRQNNELRDRE